MSTSAFSPNYVFNPIPSNYCDQLRKWLDEQLKEFEIFDYKFDIMVSVHERLSDDLNETQWFTVVKFSLPLTVCDQNDIGALLASIDHFSKYKIDFQRHRRIAEITLEV